MVLFGTKKGQHVFRSEARRCKRLSTLTARSTAIVSRTWCLGSTPGSFFHFTPVTGLNYGAGDESR